VGHFPLFFVRIFPTNALFSGGFYLLIAESFFIHPTREMNALLGGINKPIHLTGKIPSDTLSPLYTTNFLWFFEYGSESIIFDIITHYMTDICHVF